MQISAMRRVLFATAAVITSIPFDATGKDLSLLTRLLIPGYIAQDFAAFCGAYDPGFLPEMKNGSAAVAAYAQHLKIEITVNLTEADAMSVMRMAADTALGVARDESRKLLPENDAAAHERLKAWCERSARPFIVTIIKLHAERHAEFDKIVQAAKR